jgi:uncharacterized protein (TIRG00374 family)
MIKNKRFITNILRFTFGFFLFFILFNLVDIGEMFSKIKGINFTFFLMATIMHLPIVYFSSTRIKLLLDYYEIKIDKNNLFKINLKSSFFNNFLPSSVGGDTYKYFAIRKSSDKRGKFLISILFLDRFVSLITLLVLNLLFFIFYFSLIRKNNLLFLSELIIITLGFVLFLILINRRRITKSLFYTGKIRKFNESLNKINNLEPKIFLLLLFNSLVIIGLGAISSYLILLSIGFSLNFFYVLFINILIRIIGLIPISINSVGISEGVYLLSYSLAGLSNEISLLAGIINRFSYILASSIGGIILIYDNQIKNN